jgi:8-oxo-dGTP pyrophosphatase MutT (NUDIX family)
MVRTGELPEVAAIREAYEETGLAGLSVSRYLGVNEYDARPYSDTIQVAALLPPESRPRRSGTVA